MGRSQHTFQKRQREKAKAKKKIEKMEEREKRKQEKGENNTGLEIDWGSAPTEKTLLVNDIDPVEIEGAGEDDTESKDRDENNGAEDKPKAS